VDDDDDELLIPAPLWFQILDYLRGKNINIEIYKKFTFNEEWVGKISEINYLISLIEYSTYEEARYETIIKALDLI